MDPTERPSFVVPAEEPAEPVTPRASATVIVVRDGTEGIEVFMLERHIRSDFAGGAYVFPGGKLDDRDLEPELAGSVDGWQALQLQMGEPDETLARGLMVCAIRETFEEAGILIARHDDGTPVRLIDSSWADRRRALAEGELTPLALARESHVRYAADLLRFWQRWVTPVYAPIRYDARFFAAVMPAGQDPLHDEVETTASVWVRPADAIARGRAGELSIIFPTRKTLETLHDFARAEELFAAAVDRSTEPILPRVVIENGEGRIYLPGDPNPHEP